MPENTVYVGRPTKWGNPFKVVDRTILTPAYVVGLYRLWFPRRAEVKQLRGKDLACFCRLDSPCHADVLLEWANGGEA